MSFDAAMRAAGLRPKAIYPDGRWRRCSTDDKPHKKNGAYVLHPDGRGFFKNWATDTDLNAWSDGSMTKARPIDMARLAAQRERERAYRVQAMRSVRTFWNNARPLNRPHPYIERKGLTPQGCAGLRTQDELLVVPIALGDWIINVQTISPDGEKRFWPGAPVKAGTHLIDRPKSAMTVIVEGLATGLAVYQTVKHARVVVAFNAGNLLPAVEAVKPCGSVVIAADNDWKTLARRGMNPGVEKARNAAELIGCGVAYPEGIEGSDWADALKEWGEPGARKVERQILAGARYVMVT